MGVGGLQHVVVGPMAGGHVGEHHQTAVIIGNIVLVSLAAQQAVDNGDDFRPVNGIVGPEGAVAVAPLPSRGWRRP